MKLPLLGCLLLLISSTYAQDVINESISTTHASESNSTIRVSSATGETVYVGGSNANVEVVEGSIQPHLLLNIGVSEIPEVIDVSIYPNPTSDYIHISKENSDAFKGQVIDANGKLLKRFLLTESISLDFSSYAAGYYSIVLFNTNNLRNTYKVIKQ